MWEEVNEMTPAEARAKFPKGTRVRYKHNKDHTGVVDPDRHDKPYEFMGKGTVCVVWDEHVTEMGHGLIWADNVELENPPPSNLVMDGNLALLVGQVTGALLERSDIFDKQVRVEKDDAGNYTNSIFIDRPSGTYILTIIKELKDEDIEVGEDSDAEDIRLIHAYNCNINLNGGVCNCIPFRI